MRPQLKRQGLRLGAGITCQDAAQRPARSHPTLANFWCLKASRFQAFFDASVAFKAVRLADAQSSSIRQTWTSPGRRLRDVIP